MEHFATHAFRFAGRNFAVAEQLDGVLDTRTLAHLRVAGWVTAIPATETQVAPGP